MLTMFALMLQTATLDADTAKAAMQCAPALTIVDAGAKSPMRLTSQFTYLMMQSAKAKPGTGTFFEHLNALSEQASKATPPTPEAAKLVAPLCDRRFPLTRSDAPAQLPRDSFHRDLLCFGTLSVLQGAAEELAKNGGGDTGLTKIKAALQPLTDKMSDEELKRRGLSGDGAFLKALSEEMIASVPVGNPLSIAAACGVTLT